MKEYNRTSARLQAILLFLPTIAILIPSLLSEADAPATTATLIQTLSVGLSMLLPEFDALLDKAKAKALSGQVLLPGNERPLLVRPLAALSASSITGETRVDGGYHILD